MDDGAKKGTVTSVDSLFAPEEAAKAARRVEEAISNRRSELGRLRGFVSDNAALISLVQKLPDELSHDIMVPFGGAAFFPGRLIHTNEFLVLLGEGYYSDRTAKQTVEILQRRGKALESQVEAVKAMVLDMEAEARFFDSTAAEAAEGLVEIREEYVEQTQEGVPEKGSQSSFKADKLDNLDEDDEHARIMARLDELEKEELEAGSASGDDEDENAVASDESENAVTNNEAEDDKTSGNLSCVNRHALGSIQDGMVSDEREDGNSRSGFSTSRDVIDDHVRSIEKIEDSIQTLGFQEMSDPTAVKPVDANTQQKFNQGSDSDEDNARNTPTIISTAGKSFTSTIVEHSHDLLPIQLPKSTTADQPSSSNPSRPVSRFKMMRQGRC